MSSSSSSSYSYISTNYIYYLLVDIDDCDTNDCVNGTCVDGINEYTCNCNEGYSGQFCNEGNGVTNNIIYASKRNTIIHKDSRS